MSGASNKPAALFALAVAAIALSGPGCSKLMAGLRRDLDDQDDYYQPPTTGGRWAERGLLDADDGDERYRGAVGHSERNPAGADYNGRGRRDSWVSEDRALANGRDRARGQDGDGEQDPELVTSGMEASVAPPVRRQYKNGARATRSDFVDESTNEGSLWASDGQTNYYFTKNKIRGVGDIVTVTVEQDMVRDVALEMRRTLTPREKEVELDLAQTRLNAKANGLPDPDKPAEGKDDKAQAGAPGGGGTQTAEAAAAAAALAAKSDKKEARPATLSDIDLGRTLQIKPGETIMAEIVERYPNGNYKLRGMKKIPYKSGSARLLNLVGIARGADISEEDAITSGKLYEYRLEAAR